MVFVLLIFFTDEKGPCVEGSELLQKPEVIMRHTILCSSDEWVTESS